LKQLRTELKVKQLANKTTKSEIQTYETAVNDLKVGLCCYGPFESELITWQALLICDVTSEKHIIVDPTL
jgi:hypothetical protein